MLPLFAVYLGGNSSDIGMVAAVSSFMGVVASVPAGILSDKIGRKRMLIASALIFSTAPFLYLFITSIWQLMFVRFYHGLATAIFVPVAMAYISELFHRERGEKLGWFSTATLLGRFAAPIVGGTFISLLVFSPAWSYKGVYLLCAVTGIVTLILAYKLPDPVLTTGQRNWQSREVFKNFGKVIQNRAILFTCVVEAAVLFAYGTFETFLPIYAIQSGHSPYEIGILLSVQIITLAVTKPFMGKFSDRHGRKPQIVIGSLITAISIGVLPFLSGLPLLLLMSVFIGISLSIVTSATSAYIADLSKKESYGSAMGLLGSIMDIGHTTGPLISGIVAYHYGIEKSFWGASIVVATAGILLMFILGIKKDSNEY